MTETLLKLMADYDQQLANAVRQVDSLGWLNAVKVYRRILQTCEETNDPSNPSEAFVAIMARFAVVGFLAASINLDTGKVIE